VSVAYIAITKSTGEFIGQATTQAGLADFTLYFPADYNVRVVAAGYETAVKQYSAIGPGGVLLVSLEPARPDSSDGSPAMPLLAPKAQKFVTKALEALRASKPADARAPLEAAYRLAPSHPYVNYLYGIYYAQIKDLETAKSYWEKTLTLFPKHVGTLLYLSDALIRENQSAEAVPYLNRAVEAEPAAWRPHAMLAQAYLRLREYDQTVKQADRALELGHSQAAGIEPVKARALVAQGKKELAMTLLKEYVREYPADTDAEKLLDFLRAPAAPVYAPLPSQPSAPAPSKQEPPGPRPVSSPPLPTAAWMPPDVDEKPRVALPRNSPALCWPGFRCPLPSGPVPV
jgi:tetratricopeptide (TPR) repeat protein